MFFVQTSTIIIPVINVEVVAAASVFYLVLMAKVRKGKKHSKAWVRWFLEKGVCSDLLLAEIRVDE